jgi:putative hydrolase of HD superfamily
MKNRRKEMQIRQLIEFLGIMEKLKCNTRHVWNADGRQESVADHCWRLSIMALLVADEFPDIDLEKVVKMCLIHDFGEALTGDIPSFYKTKQDEENESLAVTDLLKHLPESVSNEFSGLFSEMAELTTDESKLFKALDRMEAIISHNESPLDTWLELEYTENLIYGIENVAHSDYLREFRETLKNDSLRKIEEGI